MLLSCRGVCPLRTRAVSGAGQGFPTEVSSVLSSMFTWSGGLLTPCFQRHCVEAPSGRYRGNAKFWAARAFPHYCPCLWAPQKETKEGDGLGQNVLFSFLFTSLDVRRETGMYWEGAAEAKPQADLISIILQIHTPRCSEPHPSTGEEKAKKVASNTAWLPECAQTYLHSGPFIQLQHPVTNGSP